MNSRYNESRIINTALLTEQLKRFWAIGVLPMLAYILSVVIPLHSQANHINISAQSQFMVTVLSMAHPAILILMVLAPLCVAMALYPYNFSGKATVAFYSFPITKTQLFWTNFTAGAILLLLPLLILSLVLLVPVYFNAHIVTWERGINVYNLRQEQSWNVNLPPVLFSDGLDRGDVINTFGRVFGFFSRAAIGFMFYYSVFLVAVSVAGIRVISVLISALLPFIPVAVHALLWGIGNLYVFGTSNIRLTSDITETLIFSNPVLWGTETGGRHLVFMGVSVARSGIGTLILHYIIYIAIAVAMFAISYLCCRKRKHERTEDSVVFKPVKNVLVFILAMGGMVIGAAFFATMFQSRFWWYAGGAIGFVIFYFIGQMIAEKSFGIIKQKAKPLIYFGATIVVLYIAMIIVTTFGMNFYVNRIPAAAQIHGVSFSHWHTRANAVTEPDIIARTTQIHNDIINNRRYLRRAFWENINMSGAWGRHNVLNIVYHLSDGTQMSRRYTITRDFWHNHGIDNLLAEPLVILAHYPALRHPEVIEFIEMGFDIPHPQFGWVHESRIITDRLHVLSLAEAIKADYLRSMELRRDDSANLDREIDTEISWFNFSINVLPRFRDEYDTSWVHVSALSDGSIRQWMDEHWWLFEQEYE